MGTKRQPDKKRLKSEEIAEKAKNAKFLADSTLKPSVNSAAVIAEYGKTFGDQDIGELISSLSSSITDVNSGDITRCEGILMGQAYALQSIFMNLSRRANTQQYMNNMETFLKLALKAQSQCRATLETLATIKNPPVIFAKQANIAGGHQQINNGTLENPSHAEKIKNTPNELLEVHDGSTTLDTGTTGATVPKNKAMAAVG